MQDEDCINLNPARLARHAVERAAAEATAAVSEGKSDRWWFVITDVHQALTAALVAALSGASHIDALKDQDAAAWRAYDAAVKNGESPEVPREGRIPIFSVLLERAQDAGRAAAMGGTLALSDRQRKALCRLNAFRNDLDHVKPREWFVQVGDLPIILGSAASALDQLFAMNSIQRDLEPAERNSAKIAIDSMLSQSKP